MRVEGIEHASGAPGSMVFATGDDVIALYVPSGGEATLQPDRGRYTVAWYNQRTGGALQPGMTLTGGGAKPTGRPPGGGDWAALVRRTRVRSAADFQTRSR